MGLLGYMMVVISVLTIIWNVSSVGRYYIKFLIFYTVSALSATLPIPIMFLKPRDSKNALIPSAGLRLGSKILGLTLHVGGQENIVKNSGCVVLINHQSLLDLIVLAMLWPIMDNCTMISKKEIFYLQPFGLASWLWGTIFIDRSDPKEAQNAVNKTGATIRNRKARVLIFPEGTRNSKKTLLPFKKGAFHLALASGCPIQPVAVGRFSFLGNKRFDSGEIRVKILPPIYCDSYSKETISDLIDKTYNVMAENVDKLSNNNSENNNNNNNDKKLFNKF